MMSVRCVNCSRRKKLTSSTLSLTVRTTRKSNASPMFFVASRMYATLETPSLETRIPSLQRARATVAILTISNVCSSTSPKHQVTMLEETRVVQTPTRALIRPANNTSKDALLNVVAVNPQRKAASGTATAGTMSEAMTETMTKARHLRRATEGTPISRGCFSKFTTLLEEQQRQRQHPHHGQRRKGRCRNKGYVGELTTRSAFTTGRRRSNAGTPSFTEA